MRFRIVVENNAGHRLHPWRAFKRKVGGIACAVAGHPECVRVCFGQVTCARCDAIVGDCLAGAYSFKGKTVVK